MLRNRKAPSKNQFHSPEGFTLLELSIVILVVGVLLTPLLRLYQTYQIEELTRKTKEHITVATNGIGIFSPIRLPCPADRSLSPNNPAYGFEVCNLALIPNCTPFSNQGICQTNGSRDADGNGVIDKVVIGGVPLRWVSPTGDVLNLPLIKGDDLFDAWDRKLTYAVSAVLMDPARTDAKNDFKFGSISALDENGNPTAGIIPPGDAQFVVLSHGSLGNGAFVREGIHIPCPAGMVESENCNNDFTFVQAIGSYEGSGATYYDDLSHFYAEASGDLWAPLTDALGNPTNHIINLNANNVGIRTTTPMTRLDVNGNIDADTVRSDLYCNAAGADCIPFDNFVGNPGYECLPNKVPTKIQGNKFVCVNPVITLPAGYAGVTCAGPGNWIQGILSNGCVICTDGSKVC